MSIQRIDPLLQHLKPIEPIQNGATEKSGTPKGQAPAQFADMFVEAIKEVDSLQKDADHKIEGLVLGKEGFTTHSAMVALEKADIAFQLMNQVRSKITMAYQQIMRTQL